MANASFCKLLLLAALPALAQAGNPFTAILKNVRRLDAHEGGDAAGMMKCMETCKKEMEAMASGKMGDMCMGLKCIGDNEADCKSMKEQMAAGMEGQGMTMEDMTGCICKDPTAMEDQATACGADADICNLEGECKTATEKLAKMLMTKECAKVKEAAEKSSDQTPEEKKCMDNMMASAGGGGGGGGGGGDGDASSDNAAAHAALLLPVVATLSALI